MSPRLRKGIAALLLLLWVSSLMLPTLRTNGSDWGYGWWILASGWMGLLIGQFAWLANPLFLVAIMLLLKRRATKWLLATCGLLMLLLCLQMAATTSLVDNEGGIAHPIELRYIGYWIWLATIGFTGIACVTAALNSRAFGYPGPDDVAPA